MPGSAIERHIYSKVVPLCTACPTEEKGVIKPDIIFFGEKLPLEFDVSFEADKDKVDLLIVIGSSLKVAPVANLRDKIPAHVPQILINREALQHMNNFDVQLLGYSDIITAELCRRMGWSDAPEAISTCGNVPHVFIIYNSNGFSKAHRWFPNHRLKAVRILGQSARIQIQTMRMKRIPSKSLNCKLPLNKQYLIQFH